jgi:hypothetical protein
MIRGGDGATVDVDPTDAGVLYSMGQYASSIARSSGGGWAGLPKNLPSGADCFNLHYQVHPRTTTTLLASCNGLWRTTTNSPPGDWQTIFTPPAGSILRSTVDRTVDLYYAGASDGRIYAGPGGAGWQTVFTHAPATAVTDIEIDPDSPTTVYATFGGTSSGRVYRLQRLVPAPTALLATDITADLPAGRSVFCIGVDRNAPFTVYVGTDQGVYRGRSIDGGATWSWTPYNNGMPPARVVDLEVHPSTGVMRAATFGRGAFEVNTGPPVGSLLAAAGRVSLLRVHDPGTGYGPPTDFLDADVIVWLDTQPGKAFGFQLRPDAGEVAHAGMLRALRDAFKRGKTVQIDYVRTGIHNGRIIRVMEFR